MTPLLLLLVTAAAATVDLRKRHYGSSLIITPRGNLNGTVLLEVCSLQTSRKCHVSAYFCLYGDCGSPTESSVTQVAWNSYNFSWCFLEVKTKIQLQHNHPIALGYPASHDSYRGNELWIPNVRGPSAAWAMMAHVDLGIRSDTRELNRPPVSAMPPIIRVTKNCPRTFNLLMFDPDGDHVRCRVPTSSSTDECGLCGATRDFSLDQNSCSLTYSNSGATGNHPIELVLEDFPHQQIKLYYTEGYFTIKYPLPPARRKRFVNHTSSISTIPTAPSTYETTLSPRAAPPVAPPAFGPPTFTPEDLGHWRPPPALYQLVSIPPLSKVPLQFTVHVDSHDAPSCLDGDYFPVFLDPTPSNRATLPVLIGHTLEIKVRSAAESTTVFDLIVIGPGGISKRFISTGFYMIKWQPDEHDLNAHFPICFISQARDSSNQVYESEPRCVTVKVNRYEVVVTCNQRTMTVEVEKDFVIKHNEEKLHLNDSSDSSCSLTEHSNATHLVAVVSLSACGTRVEENEDNIIFRNEITSADPNEVVTRQHEVEISLSCVYPRRTNLTLGFRHKNPNAIKKGGFGSFTFQFEFFKSPQFRRRLDGNTYPVEVGLGQTIYMQIEATSFIPYTELFVESCWATPYDNPDSPISYSIIENGCVKDKTVKIYSGSRTQFRFGMEAFEFIGGHDEVYITCSVVVCESGIPTTRCSQGCIQPGSSRRKRMASAETSSHMVSQGPFRLVKTSDTRVSVTPLSLVMILVLSVGCLLACAVVVFRSWRSRDTYQRLPTFEID